jgi:NMD protein affecting ribosome stability and mRNA decay
MEIKPRFCPICGDEIISDKGRILPNHSQTFIVLTDGHTTHIAVCKKCRDTLTRDDWKELTKLNMQYVADEIEDPEVKKMMSQLEFVKFRGE